MKQSKSVLLRNLAAENFWGSLIVTAALLLLATVVNHNIVNIYGKTLNVTGINLLAIVAVSMLTCSYAWGIFSVLYSVVMTNFSFAYPYFELDFRLTGYPLTFFVMTAVSLVACLLTVNLCRQRNYANEREQTAQRLNEADRKLLQIDDEEQLIALLLDCLYIQVKLPVFYLERQEDALVCMGSKGGDASLLTPACYERVWQSLEEGRPLDNQEALELEAQRKRENRFSRLRMKQSEETEQDAGLVCFPLLWQQRRFGAACILAGDRRLSPALYRYAEGLVNHFAIAFTRQKLSEAQARILLEKQDEQTRGYLLRAISHDLRTPLTGILGASSSLLENGDSMQPELKQRLLRNIQEEAQWLLRMIENVLSVTKIGNHSPELQKTLEPVEEVVADSVARCRKYFPNLKVEVSLPDELIMLPMDPILIRQVLINLLDNACRYGNGEEKIELAVWEEDAFVNFSVQDYGAGMEPAVLNQAFQRSDGRRQREGDQSRGLGLGMTICRTIVEAHGGGIFAENVPGKGLKVTFRLPAGTEQSFVQ